MRKYLSKAVIVLVLVATIAGLKFSGVEFSLEELSRQRSALTEHYHVNPAKFIALYLVAYIGVTAVSLPGAVIFTLAGGAIFGFWLGTLLASIASTIGATLAFIAARYVFRDSIQQRFGAKLDTINRGVEREGKGYLFALRLVPLFPFFLINFLMALTTLPALTFLWVSQIGMLPGTMLYVNAGTQLATITSVGDIFSASIGLSFALLGIFPLLVKAIVGRIRERKQYAAFQRPTTFDYNVVVIGAGSGGLVTAYVVAALKGKVALIERNKMGGDCLNTGCVPSKALIRTSRLLADAKRAKDFGIHAMHAEFDFAEVMQRVQAVIQEIEPHDSVERYQKLGVDCIHGDARIISPFEVRVADRVITSRSIVIATGGRPFIPSLPGLTDAPVFTSDTIWELRKRPEKLIVLGGGPVGCELAQCFARLGSAVTIVQRGKRLLPKEDPEFSQLLVDQFQGEGLTVLLDLEAVRIESEEGRHFLVLADQRRIEFDALLLAVGRKATVTGLGLEELGFRVRDDGTLEADESLSATYPNIFTCGDVTGPYQFTHVASLQAGTAALNSLFGFLKRFKVDYRVIPWCTFTEPEIARVGISEQEGREQKIEFEVTTYSFSDLDRAIADADTRGMIKLLTPPGSDKILGVTVAGSHAGDLISEFVFAMKNGLGVKKIFNTIHIYPTLAESNRYVAGAWQRRNQPERLLRVVEKFHTWRRG